MSDAPTSPPAAIGSPHSARTILLRLLAAAAVAAIAVVIDRVWLADDPGRSTFGATVRTFTVESDLLDRTLPAKVVVPKDAPPKDRSLLVFLHGRGEDERSYLVDPMFEALAGRRQAPVVAFPFGGESSYWHNRESGPWSSYVLTEVIPDLVRRFDIDPDRIAIGGISMGGFGAYDIARLDPGSFCAVGGHSPAIWETASETAEGAFDDPADFERNNVIEIAKSDPRPYGGLRLWLDAGDEDPFLAGDRAFADAVREGGGRPVVKSSSGGHDSDYWNGNWAAYFQFYAHALKACGERSGQDKKRKGEGDAEGGDNRRQPGRSRADGGDGR